MTARFMVPQTRFAPAKVNLALHVTGRRADGFHLLDSIIVFPAIGDQLTLKAREPGQGLIAVIGPFAHRLSPDGDNLIARAAYLLADAVDRPLDELSFLLEKNLPVEAGIGGGSADAAAALHLLNDHWDQPMAPDDLAALGLSLGADVPVCLAGVPARMSGVGEEIAPLPTEIDGALVLLNPGVAVPTGPVFKGLDGVFGKGFGELPSKIDMAWLSQQRNDLERPAISVAPVIASALTALGATRDCQIARMSGSGATMFGLYPDLESAERAATALKAAYPDWWIKAAAL